MISDSAFGSGPNSVINSDCFDYVALILCFSWLLLRCCVLHFLSYFVFSVFFSPSLLSPLGGCKVIFLYYSLHYSNNYTTNEIFALYGRDAESKHLGMGSTRARAPLP